MGACAVMKVFPKQLFASTLSLTNTTMRQTKGKNIHKDHNLSQEHLQSECAAVPVCAPAQCHPKTSQPNYSSCIQASTRYTHIHTEREIDIRKHNRQLAFLWIQQGPHTLLQAWFRGTTVPLLDWTTVNGCATLPPRFSPTNPPERCHETHSISLHPSSPPHTAYIQVPSPTHSCNAQHPWKQVVTNMLSFFFFLFKTSFPNAFSQSRSHCWRQHT